MFETDFIQIILGGAKVKLQTVIVGPKDRGKNSDSVEYVWCAIDLPKG